MVESRSGSSEYGEESPRARVTRRRDPAGDAKNRPAGSDNISAERIAALLGGGAEGRDSWVAGPRFGRNADELDNQPAEPSKAAAPPVASEPLDRDYEEKGTGRWAAFLDALDRLPPIRLPLGPPIRWRLGLPLVLVLALAWFVFVLRGPSAEPPLPTAATPAAVQTAEPLRGITGTGATVTPAQPALGGPDAPNLGIDVVDLSLKLVAVLALAYGSLALLKRLGVGGASAARTLGPSQLAVVSSLTLAPNRNVYVIRAPGNRNLLIGATTTQINLLADLGEQPDLSLVPDGLASNFLDVLVSKLPRG